MYQQDLLSQVYSHGILQNEEHVKTWIQYRDRHKKIIEGLRTFSNELSENIIVPLGKRALMRGKLMHTNEILVCIGDGYFVKYSAQQAIALCNRRIKRSEEMLKKLEQERNLLEMRQMLPMNYGAFELGESKDVIEHWDDEKLENWRVEHRKREKEYHQKLKKLRNQEKIKIVTEDDLFKRLDQLELEEELADEFHRLEEENPNLYDYHVQEDDEYDELDEESSEEEEEVVENEKGEVNEVQNKKNTIFEQKAEESQNNPLEQTIVIKETDNHNICEVAQKSIEKIDTPIIKDTKINGKFEVSIIKEDEVEKVLKGSNFLNDSCTTIYRSTEERKHKKYMPTLSFDESTFVEPSVSYEKTKSSGRRVSFAEPHFIEMESSSDQDNDSEQDNKTDRKTDKRSLTQENHDDDVIKIDFKHSQVQSPVIEGNNKDIISPKDIYRIFCKPKSILKRPLDNYNNSRNTSLAEYNLQEDDNSENVAKSLYNIVVQDIQERKIGQLTENNEPVNKKRPISRFKLERTNLKK